MGKVRGVETARIRSLPGISSARTAGTPAKIGVVGLGVDNEPAVAHLSKRLLCDRDRPPPGKPRQGAIVEVVGSLVKNLEIWSRPPFPSVPAG